MTFSRKLHNTIMHWNLEYIAKTCTNTAWVPSTLPPSNTHTLKHVNPVVQSAYGIYVWLSHQPPHNKHTHTETCQSSCPVYLWHMCDCPISHPFTSVSTQWHTDLQSSNININCHTCENHVNSSNLNVPLDKNLWLIYAISYIPLEVYVETYMV